VIPVPSDALDGVDAAGDETAINEGATGEAAFSDEVVSEPPPVEDEPRVEDAPVEEPPVEDEPPVEEPPIDEPPVEAYADPEPDIAEPEHADADRVESARRDPAVTGASTAEFAAIQSNRRRLPLPRLAAKTRKRIAIVMLVIGVLLLAEAALTVLWKEPFTAFIAARSQDSLDSDLAKLQKDKAALNAGDEAELAKIDDAGEREQRRMALLAANLDDSVKEGEALGRIRIPKLGTDFVFVQGTEAASLRKGPGHYHGKTTLPGEGAAVGIAGHRTTYEAPFREIDELKSGDRITLRMPYGLFTYEVTTRKIVPADFTGAFSDEQSAGAGERLVLSACHPLYSAEKRILVYAKLTASEPLGAAVETSAPTVPGVPEEQLAQRRTALRLKRLGDRQLAEGMTGKDVRELQRLLGMPVTGTFDANTTAAVVEFQRRHGLPQIGSVGPQTKRALARQSKIPSRPPTPAPVPQQTQPGTNGAPGSQTPGANGTTQPQQPGGYTPPGGTQGGTGQGTYNGPSGGAPYTAPGGTAAPQGSSP
jgi:sortase A